MSPMNDVITQLGALANEWANNNHIPEVDWARMRLLDFQDLLNRRNTLVKRLEGSACVLCEEFEPHVCVTTLFGSSALNVHV
jgi:antiviral helicase SKI2